MRIIKQKPIFIKQQFTEAKTYKEAVEFAKNEFGVNLLLENDLRNANRINEALIDLQNRLGVKIPAPKNIMYNSSEFIGKDRTTPAIYTPGKINLNKDFMKWHSDKQLAEIVNHEMCHFFHLRFFPNIKKIFGKIGVFPQIIFKKSETKQKLAGEISDYAKTDIGEYVADLFMHGMDGKKLSKEQLALYKKYGGPYCDYFVSNNK